MTKTIAQALLHRGLKKTQNEDNLLFQNAWALPSERDAYERSAVFEDSIQVYAVANGQGGPDIGDIAAETALAATVKTAQPQKTCRTSSILRLLSGRTARLLRRLQTTLPLLPTQ